jgi:signal transduction histidine kinase
LLEHTQRQIEEHGRPVEMSTVKRLQRQAARLSGLVVDLLDMSRLERDALSLRREATDIVSLISDCLDDFRLRAPNRPLSFLKPEGPVEISIDRARIHQVLSNLLDNAIKYTPDGTPIDIALERARDRVRVSVKDFGGGVRKELQEELFSPFARGDADKGLHSGGLGLGLFICRSIVELHGGTIRLSSKEGCGSTFTFELPVDVDHCTRIIRGAPAT